MSKVKLIGTGNNEGFVRYTVNGHEYKVEKGKILEVEKEDAQKLLKCAPLKFVEEIAEPIIKQPSGEIKKEEPKKKEEPFVIPVVENKKPISKEEKEALLSDVEKNLDDILSKIDNAEKKQKRGKTK